MLDVISDSDHPPLYFILLYLWMSVAGRSEPEEISPGYCRRFLRRPDSAPRPGWLDGHGFSAGFGGGMRLTCFPTVRTAPPLAGILPGAVLPDGANPGCAGHLLSPSQVRPPLFAPGRPALLPAGSLSYPTQTGGLGGAAGEPQHGSRDPQLG